MAHIYIFATLFFAVLSQVIVKWRMGMAGPLPDDFLDKILFLIRQLFSVWIMGSIFLNLLSGLSWMAAMTKFPISYAYPYMSLSFLLILVIGSLIFHEAIDSYKLIGIMFIMAGVIIASRSSF